MSPSKSPTVACGCPCHDAGHPAAEARRRGLGPATAGCFPCGGGGRVAVPPNLAPLVAVGFGGYAKETR